ncbi:MAG: O-antigen ligase family protein [Nocardioidaceae bacterium]|nr:O-antigen ligase family protein [Nocardioidaceae bacterium]NUS52135.1 O-antigen ligase family protein [Nocardioidaceae bacterium]
MVVLAPEAPPPVAAPRRGLLRRPSLLVALTVLLVAVPDAQHATGVRLASVTAADLGAVLLVGAVGLSVLGGRDLGPLRDKMLIGPVAMLVAAIVSTWWSTDPVLSLVAVSRYAEIFCLVPVAVLLAVRDRTDVAIVLGALVVLGAGEGALGVFQSATGTGAGYQGQTIRAIGTFGVTDVLAMATVVSCAQLVLLGVALRSGSRRRVWAAVGVLALTLPLLLSLSRGALLATIVAAGVMVLSTGLLRALGVGLVLAAVLVLGLSVTGGLDQTVVQRVASIGDSAAQPDSSVQDRYNLWSTAISIWHVSPVTGVGIKQFPAYRDSHAPLGLSSGSELQTATSYERGELLSPHNEYLLLLSEQGVIGLGSYLLFVLVLVARHLSMLGDRPRGDVRDVLRLVSLGWLVWYAVHLSYGDLSGGTAVMYSVLLGLMLRSAQTGRLPLAPAEHEGHRGEQHAQRDARGDVDHRVG